MVKTQAELKQLKKQRNDKRHRGYQQIYRDSKRFTEGLSKQQIEERRRVTTGKLHSIEADIYVLEHQTELKRFQKDQLSVKYEEKANELEKVAYFAVVLEEPAMAAEYFEQAFECYLNSSKYPNKFIKRESAMDSLSERAVACSYVARREDGIGNCLERALPFIRYRPYRK
jgi:hypothetical protein